jgi:FkbM family methyltransferase
MILRGQTVSRYWHAAVRRLDRPGGRALLTVPASLWVSLTYRTPCVVYWRDGNWIHHYRGAKIPHAEVGRAAPPDVFTAEARDLFLYEYTPHAGDVVLDVGAGVGAETLLFSRLVGAAGRVVSVEAHPRTFKRLTDLVAANALTNVTLVHAALSDAEGSVVISDLPEHPRNALMREGHGINVPARRLDELAAELAIAGVDLLKMNIEGAELDALRGAGGLLDQTRHVCISCHDFLGMPTRTGVQKLLRDYGFAMTTRDDAPDPWTRDYVYGVRV